MNRLSEGLLREMSTLVSAEDAAEMAIPSYLHKNPLLREMAWWRVHVLARWLEREAGKRRDLTIVDYGCGSGVLLEHASRFAKRVVGVDLVTAPAKLLVTRKALDGRVEIMTPDEARAHITPKSVDVILAGEVLEHVEPIAPLLGELGGWLRDDRSRLLVTLPTENVLYRLGRRVAGFSGHYHHANARSISRDLERAGFRMEKKRAIPLPGPLSVYWCMAFARRS